MAAPAVASTVVAYGGTVEMDGHRPIKFVHIAGDGSMLPTCQLRATDKEGNIVELALNKDDVQNIIDVMELYT
jgi:hypothetical protein